MNESLVAGAAAERTALSWLRTAGSMAIVAILMVRAGTLTDRPASTCLGAVVLAMAAGIILLAIHPSYDTARLTGSRSTARVMGATVALGCVSVAVMIVVLPP